MTTPASDAERHRLAQDAARTHDWKRWGPYLAERQWGTVREDYSADGDAWRYFPHDHARSRAYRWGEDGLLGFTDRQCRLCFGLALWNGRDPILKERLFGLSGTEGNHGEDVKEQYWYLDSTPTHSYVKQAYAYPQAEYPYARLVEEAGRRSRLEPELELEDLGVFEGGRWFDVVAELAKGAPDDVLLRITASNRGPEPATLHLLPQFWFRNTWSWGGASEEGRWGRPALEQQEDLAILALHRALGSFRIHADLGSDGSHPQLLFTENETNSQRLWGTPNAAPFVKDAFHDFVVQGRRAAVNPGRVGTKAGALYRFELPPGASAVVRLRLRPASPAESHAPAFGAAFDETMAARVAECDAFHAALEPADMGEDARRVVRQAHAGLLCSKQHYHFVVKPWLEGDPSHPKPPAPRLDGRNSDWTHLHARDIISMPDKWEYPWFAAWDLAFHVVPLARLDPHFAKHQLLLLLREWYMHPNGQIPAYEWNFGDVNPPVHAWAAWRVYKIAAPRGRRDTAFLERCFHKLLLNFTWWVNRKDADGRNLFSGGFLGLDNIGVIDRSQPLPPGLLYHQADGTAWMAFYASTMMAMALELAKTNPAYEDVASKFFEHFVAIADAMNTFGGTGLWDDSDGFYHDHYEVDGVSHPLRVRSAVGLIPLFAAEVLDEADVERLPGFAKRLRWFVENRQDLARHIAYFDADGEPGAGRRLLAIPSRERLLRVLSRLLDEDEFLSPHGVRSLSRDHAAHPLAIDTRMGRLSVEYAPAESPLGMFGGNSNWRGPVWLPLNFLLVEALERFHHFHGSTLLVECPTGSGRWMTLGDAAREIMRRVSSLFLADASGGRPCHAASRVAGHDGRVLFHEYFDGDTGKGLGAAHQTGWTALVACFLDDLAR